MAIPNDNVLKVTNFVPKAFDRGLDKWVPIYIPPDATEEVKGMVWLADDDEAYKDLDAANGMTAVTPKCVNDLRKELNEKIESVHIPTDNLVTGVKGNEEEAFRTGNVNLHAVDIGAVTSWAKFGGAEENPFGYSVYGIGGGDRSHSDVMYKLTDTTHVSSEEHKYDQTIVTMAALASWLTDSVTNTKDYVPTSYAVYNALRDIDASWITKGMISLDRIPRAAMERLVKVPNQAGMLALTKDNVQTGDTVLNTGTGIMYIVVNDSKLNSMDGYQEYKAGSAAKAAVADTANSVDWANVSNKVEASSTQPGIMSVAMYNKLYNMDSGGGGSDFVLEAATSTRLGGIKIGYDESQDDRNYAVKLSGEKAYVTVPWTNVPPKAGNSTYGGIKTGYSQSGTNYPVKVDSNGNAYVNVPGTGSESGSTWKPNTSTQEGYVASGGGYANKVWKTDASGNPAWRDDADRYPSTVSTSAPGLAPKLPNSTTKYLRGDGTWQTPPDTNTTYNAATQSAPGLMSAADKKKLDGIADGATVNNLTWQQIYPIGAVYISYDPTSPADLFGGNWMQLTGKFLRMANDVDAGGSATHAHWQTVGKACGYYSIYVTDQIGPNDSNPDLPGWGTATYPGRLRVLNNISGCELDRNSVGGQWYESGNVNQTLTYPESSLPPYQDLYAWRRTA